MKKTDQAVSCNVVLDSRTKADGLSKVYFRLKEGRVKKDINTNVYWPREYFDKKRQQLLPRYNDDPDVVPHNLRLNEYKSIAHRFLLNGFVKNSKVSIEDLVKEFKDVGKSHDFFAFMLDKVDELYNTDVISNGTWRRHRSSLNTLQKFWGKSALPMRSINLDLIERFDAWARKVHKRGHNTVCGYHKDIKKYLGVALRRHLIAENPYKDFSFAYVDGDRDALNKEEVQKLYHVYQNKNTPENEREICCRFLFSCVTGLRISDTYQLHSNMIEDQVLSLVPYKGRSKGKKLKLPLSNIARELIKGRTGLIFKEFSHQYINETLKIIAARAKINKRLTYHAARDTFGTLFIEMGGDVKSLKDLMGHANLSTTMIYLKMSDRRKEILMNNFDELF